MPVKIENLTMKPVLLRLNSGKTLHISPRATIEIMDVEVEKNAMVEKLCDRRVIGSKKEKEASIPKGKK